MLDSLCAMRKQWDEGDVQAAGRTFADELHQPLHDVASSLFDAKPALSSDVLETKGRTDCAIAAGRRPSLAEVDAFVSATEAALRALGADDANAPC